MASICPQCHEELAEDAICCARLRHTWRCRQCGKRSTGFVVPYGRCHLCGGDNEVVQPFEPGDPVAARVIEEAMQFEVNTYHFYRLAWQRTENDLQLELFRSLLDMELEHVAELEVKYHIHLDPEVLELPPDADRLLENQLFEGLVTDDPQQGIEALYEMALTMERRTRDHFKKRAAELPPGTARDTCAELAAEEEDHVAMLETELASFASSMHG